MMFSWTSLSTNAKKWREMFWLAKPVVDQRRERLLVRIKGREEGGSQETEIEQGDYPGVGWRYQGARPGFEPALQPAFGTTDVSDVKQHETFCSANVEPPLQVSTHPCTVRPAEHVVTTGAVWSIEGSCQHSWRMRKSVAMAVLSGRSQRCSWVLCWLCW